MAYMKEQSVMLTIMTIYKLVISWGQTEIIKYYVLYL